MTNTQGSHAPTLCPPGTRMLLEVAGFQDKLASICVGHIRPRFVVTTAPIVPEHNREAVHQMLYPDNTVIVRFLLEGTVMGFSAKIIRSLQVPFPLLFFTYPTRLECLDLRRHRRVPCCIPAETEVGTNATPGMIVDLSLTGCQFSACLTEGTASTTRWCCAAHCSARTDKRYCPAPSNGSVFQRSVWTSASSSRNCLRKFMPP